MLVTFLIMSLIGLHIWCRTLYSSISSHLVYYLKQPTNMINVLTNYCYWEKSASQRYVLQSIKWMYGHGTRYRFRKTKSKNSGLHEKKLLHLSKRKKALIWNVLNKQCKYLYRGESALTDLIQYSLSNESRWFITIWVDVLQIMCSQITCLSSFPLPKYMYVAKSYLPFLLLDFSQILVKMKLWVLQLDHYNTGNKPSW